MATLQEYEVINANLKTAKKDHIVALHKFIYDDIGDRNNRKRLRNFSGFEYSENDENYAKKCAYIEKNLSVADLVAICVILRLNHNQNDLKLHIFRNLTKSIFMNQIADDNDDETEKEDEEEEEENEIEQLPIGSGENIQSNDNRSVCSTNTQITSNKCHDASNEVRRTFPSAQRFTLTLRDIEGSIRDFDGGDIIRIETWIQEFEETAYIMQWDELQKYIFAKKSLKGLARLFILGSSGITTWQKLRTALLNEFERKINSNQLHRMLSERKMKRDESALEYLYHMKDLAAQGNIDDDALIQYIIDGIRDMDLNKTMLYGASNLQDFKGKLRNYETFLAKTKKTYARPEDKKQATISIRDDIKTVVHCFNCGSKGHKSSNCINKAKGTKCFKCNMYGHIAKDCKANSEEEKQKVGCLNVNKSLVSKEIKIGNHMLYALFDTGSKVNALKKDTYDILNKPELTLTNITLTGFGHNNNNIKPIGSVKLATEIDEITFEMDFLVVPNNCMKEDVIIGSPICIEAELTFNKDGVHVQKLEEAQMMKIEIDDDNEVSLHIDAGASIIAKNEVNDLINNYKPEKTKSTEVTMKIILSNEIPVCCTPRRLPLHERKVVEDRYDDYYLKSEILYKEIGNTEKLVIPKNMQNDIIKQAHEKGHFGVNKTKALIDNDYFIPKLDDKIKRIVEEEMILNFNAERDQPASTYNVDDMIAIKRTQFGGGLKLKPKYLGPYQITKVKSNGTYDVVKIGNSEGPAKSVTCSEYIKPWPDE